MPAPRGRKDDAYFEPLKKLRLPPATELYLGLVHLTDGVAGARSRVKLRNAIGPNLVLRANAASVAAILKPCFHFLISIARWPIFRAARTV